MSKTLPAHDKRAPFTDTEQGDRIVAGRHGLFFLENDQIVDAGMWYEVQYAKWDHVTRKLLIVWVEPDREPIFRVTTETEPKKFLRRLTSSVDKTIVASKSKSLSSGTKVSATARRRADGEVFTTVVIQGKTTPQAQTIADHLETELRQDLNLK